MSSQQEFVVENGVLKKYNGPGGEVVISERSKENRRKGVLRKYSRAVSTFPQGAGSDWEKCISEVYGS